LKKNTYLIELVGDVPAQRAELASLLDSGVQKGDTVEHWLPAGDVRDVEDLLSEQGVGALEAGLDTLWRLVGELERRLEQVDGEVIVRLGGDPAPEGVVDNLGVQDCLQQLLQESQA